MRIANRGDSISRYLIDDNLRGKRLLISLGGVGSNWCLRTLGSDKGGLRCDAVFRCGTEKVFKQFSESDEIDVGVSPGYLNLRI